jgi:hypothetical protein
VAAQALLALRRPAVERPGQGRDRPTRLNLTNGSDTLAAIAARDGTTEDALLDARAETKRKFEDRGLPLPAWLTGATATAKLAAEPTGGPQDQEAPAYAP